MNQRGESLASRIHQFFVTQALHLKEGRIEAVARGYAVPLVMSLPGMDPEFVVLSSRSSIERFFRMLYDGLQAADIPSLRVRVAEMHPTGPNRVAVVAERHYFTRDGSHAGLTAARYFLENRHGAISIHMIEFERVAFPALSEWFRESGRVAPARHSIH